MPKRWVIVAAAVPLVGVALAAGVLLSFDPNTQKDRIVQAVRRATGRDLTVSGPIQLGWSFTPVLEAEDVSFANMPGGSRPAMATAARVEARLKLLPLLSRRVELAEVTLVRPDILIETDAGGHGNWQFERSPPPGATAASSPGVRTTTVLDSLRIESGRVTWRNGVTRQTVVAEVPHATLEGGDGPLHVTAQAESAGVSATLEATLGTAAQVTGALPGPWPMKFAASLGDATFALDGMANAADRRVSGRVEANVPDLARLGALLQHPTWPPLHDVRLVATLPPAGGLPQDVSLQIGAADLGSVLPGATLKTLSLTWPSGQPARFEAEGTLVNAPWHMASGLAPAQSGVALRGLSLSSAVGSLAGDVTVQASPRPSLRGTLVSTRLDVDAIRSLGRINTRQSAPGSALSPPTATPVAASPARIFPDTPLPWGVLRQADLDVELSIASLHAGGADYRDAAGHIALQDGVLRIDSASVLAPGGRVGFSASADARQPAPPVALRVQSATIALDPLAQAFGLPGGSEANAGLDLALQATGATPHALASTLDGHLGVAVVDGEVSNAALAAVAGDLLRMAGARLDTAGRSHVRCLAVRADVHAGQVTFPALKLDTSRLLLTGSGTVDLAAETVALHLRPLLRLAGAGISAPIRLEGALPHPAVTLDPAAGTGRVGVVIGGLGGPADSCAAELTAARDGRPGPMPVEAMAEKPAKPADLLRSFLR